jgi:hypothetical protein
MPRSLDLDRLRQFEPPAPAPVAAPASAPVFETKMADPMAAVAPDPGAPSRWPSREPIRDGQVSIKAPLDVIGRFRAMCRDDRRTYADMLTILMDRYEGR